MVISEATYQQVKDTFECVAIPLEKNKGRADLTQGYRVIKRLRGGVNTMFLDEELQDLLGDLGV